MKLCRVIGNVYGDVKHEDFRGHKLMVVQPETPDGRSKSPTFLAVDTAGAGVGELVLVLSEGNGVRQVLKKEKSAIRSIIIGIVDAVDYTPEPR